MADELMIRVLGAPTVRTDGRPTAEVPGGRLRTLLSLLAAEPGVAVRRDRLIEELWGPQPPTGAVNALQSLVSRLRRLLPPGALAAGAGGYRLTVDPDLVDHVRFSRLVHHARACAGRDAAAAARLVREALELWRGEPFADAEVGPLLIAASARLAEARPAALETLFDAELACGNGPAIVPEIETAAREHPLRERLSGQLLRALCEAGRRAEGLARYAEVRRRLADELGVDPSPALEETYLAALRGDFTAPGAGPAVVPAPPPGPAVPRAGQLTAFVGRADDLAELRATLIECRMVTLTGPGGVGKTRLAAECVAGLEPLEVAWVELSAVHSPDDVPQAIAAVLGTHSAGVDPAGAADPAGRLVRLLQGRRLTLVLDNCEHLVDVVAALCGRLLTGCPGLRILATSRETLRVAGEHRRPVAPLALPDADAPPGAIAQAPAVRLLLERAAAAGGWLPADAPTLRAAARVCRRLDGLPLALELAASRLSGMSLGEVADRLDRPLRLLNRGSRAVEPRRRTLRAVVEWSWQLLRPEEQHTAARFGVFAGAAGLAAVHAVCAPGEPADDVLDVVTELVDKSLFVAEHTPHGTRYRMLETIRAFALEQLEADGDVAQVRRRHAAHHLRLAEEAEPQLRRAGQLEAMRTLVTAHADLHAALRWYLAQGHGAEAVRLVSALGWYWFLRGLGAEGAGRAVEALALPGEAPPAARVQTLALSGLAVEGTDGAGRLLERLDRAVALAARLTGTDEAPSALLALLEPMRYLVRGDTDGALEHVARHRGDADPWVRELARVTTARIRSSQGMPQAAMTGYLGALAGFRALGERWGTAQALSGLAEVYDDQGDHEAAVARLREALRCAEELQDVEGRLSTTVRLARSLARAGHLEEARTAGESALRLARRYGVGEQAAFALHVLGDVVRWSGDPAEGARLLLRARAEFHTSGRGVGPVPPVMALSQAHCSLALGETGAARALCGEAREAAARTHDERSLPLLAELAAGLQLADGAAAAAVRELGRAEALRGTPVPVDPDGARIRRSVRAALGEAVYEPALRAAVAEGADAARAAVLAARA